MITSPGLIKREETFRCSRRIAAGLMINGNRYTVIGVMPPGFRCPEEDDLLVEQSLGAIRKVMGHFV